MENKMRREYLHNTESPEIERMTMIVLIYIIAQYIVKRILRLHTVQCDCFFHLTLNYILYNLISKDCGDSYFSLII